MLCLLSFPNLYTDFALASLGVIDNVGVINKLNFKCLLHIFCRTGNGKSCHSKSQLLYTPNVLCHQQKMTQVYGGAGGKRASAGENGTESALVLHPGKDPALVLCQQA